MLEVSNPVNVINNLLFSFVCKVHFQEDVDEAKRIAGITGPLSAKFIQNAVSGFGITPLNPYALVQPSPKPTNAPVKAPQKKEDREHEEDYVPTPRKKDVLDPIWTQEYWNGIINSLLFIITLYYYIIHSYFIFEYFQLKK